MGAPEETLARLARAVPANVREVCATIAAAGHEAVTVGGAVRDALLDRDPGDWDVATSAHPEEVLQLFRHTIATGLQHGTVTVVTGKGKHTHVEVTTYRGEGAYSDARRPDSVTFGVPLHEDLARRDLVVNAIAYDPIKQQLIDPFGGQADIAARRLRAVGNPVDRFTEDGLRVMRAVRFAAQLEFDLDPATEAGIPPALPSLTKVSRERVSDELRKLLGTRQPSRGLRPAYRSGIVENILPELFAKVSDVEAWLARIDRADRPVRLAAFALPLATARVVEDTLRALKFSNAEAELAAKLVAVAQGTATTSVEVRKLLSKIDRDKREPALALWQSADVPDDALIAEAKRVLADREPLVTGDLAIGGNDLIKDLGLTPGPAIGKLLVKLLEFVLDDPTRNTREQLLAYAKQVGA